MPFLYQILEDSRSAAFYIGNTGPFRFPVAPVHEASAASG